MIKLMEILHTIQSGEGTDGLSEVDNWKIPDYDFLIDMGFTPDGIYHFGMKNPEITVCHKKGTGFIVNDKTRNETIPFKDFNDLMEYFSKYQQKWEHTPYL